MAQYDFVKTPVDIDTLTTEILDSTISGTYQYSNYTSPNLDVFFADSLSNQDYTTLSGIVDSHLGATEYETSGNILVADGSGGVVFSDVSASGIVDENQLIEYTEQNKAYPRYSIGSSLHIKVNNYGQYVIEDYALEIAGILELTDGGMIILK